MADAALQMIIQVVTMLTDKPEVDQPMQPCLLKNSPRSTLLLLLRVGVKPKKSNLYWLIGCPFIIVGSNIYTRNLSMNPAQVRLVTIFGIAENVPNLR